MYYRRILKATLGTMLCSFMIAAVSLQTAQAKLPSEAEAAFSDLSKDFKKTSIALIEEKSKSSGTAKVDTLNIVSVQVANISEKVERIKKYSAAAADDAITPKERFLLAQSKNALNYVKENFSVAACTPTKENGFTKFQQEILREFEPTALSTGTVESEVIQKVFEVLKNMCTQATARQSI